jgi:A/G-specific adenine glycosylase
MRWYRANHRKLPWRAAPGERGDPYHVFVSEAMLQQTQVATVVEYFNRFIVRWPSVGDLAAADEQQVLAEWQGLGYYRRARNLHRAAKIIVADHGGKVPDTVKALQALPGVGRYTAGAIASIAHGRAAPILDGNVKRVLARLFAIPEAVDERPVEQRLWSLAEDAIRRARHPGDVNQALMELGATVCTPKSPACLTCGVRKFCMAAQQGLTDELPVVGKRAKQTNVTHHVIAVEHNGRYLFEQRPGTGLWAGMWQLTTHEDGPPRQTGREIGCFVHITTHRRITFVVHHRKARSDRGNGVWRSLDHLDDLPISNAQKRAIELVRAQAG